MTFFICLCSPAKLTRLTEDDECRMLLEIPDSVEGVGEEFCSFLKSSVNESLISERVSSALSFCWPLFFPFKVGHISFLSLFSDNVLSSSSYCLRIRAHSPSGMKGQLRFVSGISRDGNSREITNFPGKIPENKKMTGFPGKILGFSSFSHFPGNKKSGKFQTLLKINPLVKKIPHWSLLRRSQSNLVPHGALGHLGPT